MKSSAVERRGAARSLFGVPTRRVAGDREQRADLAVARRLDLLGEARRPAARRSTSGRPRTRLRQRADATPVPRPGAPMRVRRARGGAAGTSRRRARSRLPVSDVEHVDEPARERAELLRASCRCGRRPRPLGAAASSRAMRRISSARDAARARRRASGANSRGQRLRPRRARRRAPRARPSRRAPRRTARARAPSSSNASVPGPDEEVLVGVSRGRVRRGSITTTLPPRARIASQPPAHVGRRQQAAVGHHRVRAEHQQVVGAVDVGHRDRQPVPNISAAARLLGHLVDRRRASRCSACRAP